MRRRVRTELDSGGGEDKLVACRTLEAGGWVAVGAVRGLAGDGDGTHRGRGGGRQEHFLYLPRQARLARGAWRCSPPAPNVLSLWLLQVAASTPLRHHPTSPTHASQDLNPCSDL